MNLTVDALLEYAKNAVAERGEDWVYPDHMKDETNSCLYATTDWDGTIKPACLVGHIIWQIDPELLVRVHAYSEGTGARTVLRDDLDCHDSRVLQLAELMQERQDNGEPWGEALRAAIAWR